MGKRSGDSGFVAHKATLVNALSRVLADRIMVGDFTLGRKGFLGYVKALAGSNIIRVTPANGADSVSHGNGKRLKVTCGSNTSYLEDLAWVGEKTPLTLCEVRVSSKRIVQSNIGGLELAEALNRVIPFTAKEDNRPVLQCVLFKASERKLTLGCGTITLRRPRVRGLLERFESRVLPLFARRSKGVSKLIPQIYLHGLALGDFDLALRGLLGGNAPVSAGTVARLKEGWQAEWREWKRRSLKGLQVVYLWVDGIYVKAGLEKEKAALLVVVAGLLDGRKVVLAVEPGYRESTESWSEVLRDLKKRGMNCPCLVIGDGNLGIWGALVNIYPGAPEQRCWNHKMVNVLDKLPKKLQGQAKRHLQDIVYSETRELAETQRDDFVRWCRQEGYRSAGETLVRDWERMVTFYRFPQEHWRHLRTTNVVESPFAGLRLRTDAAKRYKKAENATVVIWKMLMLAEQRFRRLDAPEKLMQVYLEFGFQERVAESKTKQEEVLAIA